MYSFTYFNAGFPLISVFVKEIPIPGCENPFGNVLPS